METSTSSLLVATALVVLAAASNNNMPPRYLTAEGGTTAIATQILESAVSRNKQQQYQEPIVKNHTNVKSLAKQLQEFRTHLPSFFADDPDTMAQVERFLQEQTEAVKQLAVENVQRDRRVRDFVEALQTVSSNAANEETTDFSLAIDAALQDPKLQSQHVDMAQEKMYRDVLDHLGESGGGDDDICCVAATGASSLKCPITAMLLEDPVRNTLCHHTYSRNGIRQHMRTKGRNCRCPFPGCVNTQPVTESVLERDYEMEDAVRREKRRLEQETQRIASQANDLVDSDDE